MNTDTQIAYASWQKRYPSFDAAGYARWIQQRGYHKSALDPRKPDFAEYATVYCCRAATASPNSTMHA